MTVDIIPTILGLIYCENPSVTSFESGRMGTMELSSDIFSCYIWNGVVN